MQILQCISLHISSFTEMKGVSRDWQTKMIFYGNGLKLIARMSWDCLVNVSHTIEIHTHAIKFNDDYTIVYSTHWWSNGKFQIGTMLLLRDKYVIKSRCGHLSMIRSDKNNLFINRQQCQSKLENSRNCHRWCFTSSVSSFQMPHVLRRYQCFLPLPGG